MKVVLIGGSSPSTLALIEYLVTQKNLPDIELVLLGRYITPLALVSNAARTVAGNASITIRTATTDDPGWPEAFLGADAIVLQARVGGYKAREWDETFPLRYGICGDQDLGPGGFSNAWRSWFQLKQFFIEASVRAPHARFFVLSSPVGILVRLGLFAAPQLTVMGVCELPRTTLHEICSTLEIANSDLVSFGYIGLHHMGWFYRLNLRTRDLISEYETTRENLAGFPSAHLIRKYSAIPTRYLRLHFHGNEVIEEQRQAPGARSRHLMHYREKAFATFATGCAETIKAILRERSAPWYSQAIGPLLLATAGYNTARPVFLSRRNDGALKQFPESDVLELAHVVTQTSVESLILPELIPDNLISFMRPFVVAERLAAEATWRSDPEPMKLALATHPWTSGLDDSTRSALANEVMSSRGTRS
jgi:6-phospho-beta-glucosidase